MLEFAGWDMPIEYAGILTEHKQVREAAGLFDVSHMGQILISGPAALDMVQLLVTADLEKAQNHQISYAFLCEEDGGVIDDLLIYKYSNEKFLLVVNASNTATDLAWIKKHQIADCIVRDLTEGSAIIAIQGPKAEPILQTICAANLKDLQQSFFIPETTVKGYPALISRTGYTGEHGFELYLAGENARAVWQELLQIGGADISPVGLGARDTLRFEAKLPLYGQELGRDITPLEAGLGWFVDLGKDNFIGKDALQQQKKAGLQRKLVEFKMVGRGLPRHGYPVQKDGREIGFVTTGYQAPTLGEAIGLALVETAYAKPGETIDIAIRKRVVPAEVGRGLFYMPAYRRKRK